MNPAPAPPAPPSPSPAGPPATSPAAAPPVAAGRRYELVRLLGHGGMGAVYAALDRLTGQEVALKRILIPAPGETGAAPDPLAATLQPAGVAQTCLLTPSRSALGGAGETTRPDTPLAPAAAATETSADLLRQTLEQRLAIAQEFRTLASLRHPHIISVLDYGFSDDAQPFFTMELLRDAQPLLAAQALELHAKVDQVAQILQALVYLHRRGVLHRDLKPANVLCVRSDGRTRVKVLDFGLAVANEQIARSREEIAGTLPYLAPEILLGAGASVASDLYAVGVMLFEARRVRRRRRERETARRRGSAGERPAACAHPGPSMSVYARLHMLARGPQRAELRRQEVPHRRRLRRVPRQDPEHAPHHGLGIRTGVEGQQRALLAVAEVLHRVQQERHLLALPLRLARGAPAFVVQAADQHRQLRTELHHLVDGQPIAQRVQHALERQVGRVLAAPSEVRLDLVEPDVGLLQRGIKRLYSDRVHRRPPS